MISYGLDEETNNCHKDKIYCSVLTDTKYPIRLETRIRTTCPVDWINGLVQNFEFNEYVRHLKKIGEYHYRNKFLDFLSYHIPISLYRKNIIIIILYLKNILHKLCMYVLIIWLKTIEIIILGILKFFIIFVMLQIFLIIFQNYRYIPCIYSSKQVLCSTLIIFRK